MTGVNIEDREIEEEPVVVKSPEEEALEAHMEMMKRIGELRSIAVVDSIKNFSSTDVSNRMVHTFLVLCLKSRKTICDAFISAITHQDEIR